MVKILFWVLGCIFFSSLSGHYYVCHLQNMCVDEPEVSLTAKNETPDNNSDIIEEKEYFFPSLSLYKENDSLLESFKLHINAIPRQTSVTTTFDLSEINTFNYHYLLEKPESKIVITSFFDQAKETKNIAMTRGYILRNLLNQYNLDTSNFVIETRPVTMENFMIQDTLRNYFNIQFQRFGIDETVKTRTLYCDFGSQKFNQDKSLTLYLSKVKRLYDKGNITSIAIEGHTDNVGEANSNYELGLKRAKALKAVLVNAGIPEKHLVATSKGENTPIADNASENGRQLNRRIEIQIKK